MNVFIEKVKDGSLKDLLYAHDLFIMGDPVNEVNGKVKKVQRSFEREDSGLKGIAFREENMFG